MVNSQNGWPASPDRRSIGVGYFEVAGVEFPGGVKTGDVAVVLANVAREIHERVERLREGECWGHNFRAISGSPTVSNHGSGTAIDINAPLHPIGKRNTFTAKQQATIRAILRAHDDVVRWGGDYAGRPDDMHFEINASASRVAALARKIRNTEKEDDVTKDEVKAAIREVLREPFVNPREDNKTGRKATLEQMIKFEDWRYVRLINAVKAMITPLYDDEAKAAAASRKLEALLADLQDGGGTS
jgi:hypothetical protein